MVQAGCSNIVINNDLGTDIQAAGHMRKVASIRDNLEANALWIESEGQGMLFINCDLCGLDMLFIQRLIAQVAAAADVPEERVMIGCSHTHNGPSVVGPTHPDKPLDEAYIDKLEGWLCQIARQAVSSARPVRIAWGVGEAVIGYNRRVCFADGSHQMHGDAATAEATGLEGPADNQHAALFVQDMEGKLMAVLYNNTAHPINFYGCDFLSADFPGLTRTYLRQVLGEISVIFFNGALGDMSIVDEHWKKRVKETPDQRVARAAHQLTGETLRLLQHADFRESCDLGHVRTRFEAKLRALPPERLAWAQQVMADYRSGKAIPQQNLVAATAHLTLLLHERFAGQETETLDLHTGHIGDFAFTTVPLELFCQFALNIKRRSPFPATSLFALVNGSGGYCPTTEGIHGGSWEGTVSLTSRVDGIVGYQIVDEACRCLHELWQNRKYTGKPGEVTMIELARTPG